MVQASQVSVRELRNHGGDVLDRVEAGEHLTVTRNGRPVAQLVPLPRRPLGAVELVQRAAALPEIDPVAFRAGVDALVDTRLFPADE
jgi:prevent-host-death family protein